MAKDDWLEAAPAPATHRKNGAIYISIREHREGMALFFFPNVELYHHYGLSSASFFECVQASDAPAKAPSSNDEIIAHFRTTGQVVKVRDDVPGLE